MDKNSGYSTWLEKADGSLQNELKSTNPEQIADAFRCGLAFGTGGLRGVIGAGTNRMNIHTVAKATQGLAMYINTAGEKNRSVAISYDSRHKSVSFSKVTAGVFATNGIHVFIYPLSPSRKKGQENQRENRLNRRKTDKS